MPMSNSVYMCIYIVCGLVSLLYLVCLMCATVMCVMCVLDVWRELWTLPATGQQSQLHCTTGGMLNVQRSKYFCFLQTCTVFAKLPYFSIPQCCTKFLY